MECFRSLQGAPRTTGLRKTKEGGDLCVLCDRSLRSQRLKGLREVIEARRTSPGGRTVSRILGCLRSRAKIFALSAGLTLVRRRIRWIAQGDELSRRIVRLRQWRLRSVVDNGQHLAAAHALNRQALTLNRNHPVVFLKELPFPRLHTGMGCKIPSRRFHLNCKRRVQSQSSGNPRWFWPQSSLGCPVPPVQS